MRISRYSSIRIIPIAMLLIFSSCEPKVTTHWIRRAELHPASKPNIQSLTLTNGKSLIFNSDLGWYDHNLRIIEGVTLTGWHPSVSLDNIDSIEVVDRVDYDGSALATGGIILLTFLGIGLLVGFIELAHTANSSGCLILIGILTIGTAMGIILLA